MTEFSPWNALSGGLLIGLAAVILMLFLGRIAGISGILSGALSRNFEDWRMAFLVGLVSSALAFPLVAPDPITVTNDPFLLIFGGLAVGIGSRLGSGCTSGHGVCGVARLSIRSITATIIFMAVAIITIFIIRQVLGLS